MVQAIFKGCQVILDSTVGRARVCRCQPLWEGATTQRTPVHKAEQRPHGDWQGCNRVRSALTQRVNAQNGAMTNRGNNLCNT